MKLSVIIVNYNVRYFLEQCIHSVYRAAGSIPLEVIVVDNQSTDGSVEMLRQKFPEVKLIANQHNPGFSIANNQGLAIAEGEYILFLNPDTLVAEDCFESSLNEMDAQPKVGALGVRMLDGSGRFLPESKRGLPTFRVAFFKMCGLHHIFPGSAFFNRYYMGQIAEMEAADVEVLCGAFMLMRKSLLDEIGGFDERFFMYGEDIDLSYRVNQAGFRVRYWPKTSIIHYKGESTKKGSLNYVKHFYNAMILFSEKHFQGSYSGGLRMLMRLGIYGSAVLAVLRNFTKRIFWPVMDILILVLIFVITRIFWASWYHKNPDYYTDEYYFFNIPIFAGLWFLSLYFSGVYETPYKISRLIKAMVAGLLLNGLVYGLLSEGHRPSRAILLLGFMFTTLGMTLIRSLIYKLQYKKLPFGRGTNKRIALVGNSSQWNKINEVDSSGQELLGWIGEGSDTSLNHLGQVDDLQDIVRIHKIDELIFSADILPIAVIMRWMKTLGPDVMYKIATPGSEGIVGSHSKNSSGQWYTFDVNYKLSKAEYRRMKRVIDVLLSLGMVFGSPILVWTFNNKSQWWSNVLSVLRGDKSIVGYGSDDITALPSIKTGVLSVSGRQHSRSANAAWMDMDYARNYSIWKDFEILANQWSFFDQSN